MESSACKICFLQLEGPDRRPRFLGCGHSFCTNCIIKMIYNNKVKCPLCFKIQENVKNVEDLPIAYALEELVGAMSVSKPKVPPKPKAMSVPKQVSNKDDNSLCKEHKFNNIFYCDNHHVFICHVCTIVEHPNTKCKVITKQEIIDQKKTAYSNTLENLFKSSADSSSRYKLFKKEIVACKEQHKELSSKLWELAQMHSDQAIKLDQSCKYIQDAIEVFKITQTQIETMKVDISSSKSLTDLVKVKNNLNPLVSEHNNFWKETWAWHQMYMEVHAAREDIVTGLKEFIGKEKEELKKSTNRACNLEGGAQKTVLSKNKTGQKDSKSADFEIHIPHIFHMQYFKKSRK
ncbi:unnamed protein product, partial [Meganyctiphanes norvegica]